MNHINQTDFITDLKADVFTLISQRDENAKLYFQTKQVEIPALLREIDILRKALEEISTFSHCIALSGPMNTPDLQSAWQKFMKIDSMASTALHLTKR